MVIMDVKPELFGTEYNATRAAARRERTVPRCPFPT